MIKIQTELNALLLHSPLPTPNPLLLVLDISVANVCLGSEAHPESIKLLINTLLWGGELSFPIVGDIGGAVARSGALPPQPSSS